MKRKKSVEKAIEKETKTNEKFKVDHDFELFKDEAKINHMSKINRFIDDIKITKGHHEKVKSMEIVIKKDEDEKYQRELFLKSMQELELQNMMKNKKNELKKEFNIVLKKQVKEKKENLAKEKENIKLLDKAILEGIEKQKFTDQEQGLKRKNLFTKYIGDLNNQATSKNIYDKNEMDKRELLINRDIIAEMKNYVPITKH